MSEEFTTIYFDEPIKKIWFNNLSIRMWRYKNGITQSELMKKLWADPNYRKGRKKHYDYSEETLQYMREHVKKYMQTPEATQKMREAIRKKFKNGEMKSVNHDLKKKSSPFFMVDGITEVIVEKEREKTHGVVVYEGH